MGSLMIVFLVILVAAVFIGIRIISVYNKLVQLRNYVDEGWSGIDVQLKRRYDLIPNLVEIVKGYSIHEKSVLENVTRLRSVAMSAKSLTERTETEAELTKALKTLFAVAENYPELKANENFLSLQKTLTSIEDEIQLSRRYYNGAVRNYNIAISVFPSSLIANLTGFKKVPYFEVQDVEREPDKIKFD